MMVRKIGDNAAASRAPSSNSPAQEIDGQRYVNSAQVRAILGDITEMTLWRWERELDFPSPVKLGAGGRNFWWLPTVMEWAHSRAARDNQHRAASGRHQRQATIEATR